MKNTLIAGLVAHFNSGAACASALGITRQSFNAAMQRNRLSNDAAIHAARLLGIDEGAALLSNATAPRHLAAPIINPCPYLPPYPSPHTLYYVKSINNNKRQKIADNYNAALPKNVHFILSKIQLDAIDLIRWVYSVVKFPADSPRFDWYVSRWLVPEKIAAAKFAGTYEETVKGCPHIDPAWIKLVPSAISAYALFRSQHFESETPQSSATERPRRKIFA